MSTNTAFRLPTAAQVMTTAIAQFFGIDEEAESQYETFTWERILLDEAVARFEANPNDELAMSILRHRTKDMLEAFASGESAIGKEYDSDEGAVFTCEDCFTDLASEDADIVDTDRGSIVTCLDTDQCETNQLENQAYRTGALRFTGSRYKVQD